MPNESISEGDEELAKARASGKSLSGGIGKPTPKATTTETAAAKRERLAALAELTEATEFAPKGTGSGTRARP